MPELPRSSARRLALAALSLVAAIALVVACGGDDGDPTPAQTFKGTDGAVLFREACATCHGADLNGTDKGPPFLDVIYAPGHHADPSFFLAARTGARSHHWNFGNMPPIEGLSDDQIAAIVAFVRSEQRAAGIQ